MIITTVHSWIGRLLLRIKELSPLRPATLGALMDQWKDLLWIACTVKKQILTVRITRTKQTNFMLLPPEVRCKICERIYRNYHSNGSSAWWHKIIEQIKQRCEIEWTLLSQQLSCRIQTKIQQQNFQQSLKQCYNIQRFFSSNMNQKLNRW